MQRFMTCTYIVASDQVPRPVTRACSPAGQHIRNVCRYQGSILRETIKGGTTRATEPSCRPIYFCAKWRAHRRTRFVIGLCPRELSFCGTVAVTSSERSQSSFIGKVSTSLWLDELSKRRRRRHHVIAFLCYPRLTRVSVHTRARESSTS